MQWWLLMCFSMYRQFLFVHRIGVLAIQRLCELVSTTNFNVRLRKL